MAFFNGWPWANFQEQNLNWMIDKIKQLERAELDYEEFKKEMYEYISNLNVPEEVANQIQELLDDGTIEQIVQDIGIATLFANTFLLPEQFKTDLNTWDDAFEALALAGEQGIIIPNATYDLSHDVYLGDNVVSNSGIFPNGKVITPENVILGNCEHLRSINKWNATDYLAQGACMHGTTYAYVALDSGDSNAYVKEYTFANMSLVRSLLVGPTASIHGNSICWDAQNNRYLIAPSYGIGTIYAVDQLGNVQTLTVPTGDVIDVVIAIEDGFLIGRHNVSLFQCAKTLDIIREITIPALPPLPNNNAYTGYQNMAYYKGRLYYMVSSFGYATDASGFVIWSSPLANIKWSLYKDYTYSEHFRAEEAESIIFDNDILYVGSYTRNYIHILSFDDNTLYNGSSGQNLTIYVNESLTVDGYGTQASPINSLDEAIFYARKGYSINATSSRFPSDAYIVGLKCRIYGSNLTLAGIFVQCDLMFNAGSFIINDRWTLRMSKAVFDAGGTINSTNTTGGYDHELIWVSMGSMIMCRGMVVTAGDASVIPIRLQIDGRFYGFMTSNCTYNIETYYGGYVFWNDSAASKVNKRGTSLVVTGS